MSKGMTYVRIFVNFLLTLVGVLLVIFLLPRAISFFLPFVIALCISSIANPFVRFMEKKIKIVRKGSAVIMIVAVLGAVVGILYLVIRFLVEQIMNLYADRFLIYDEVVAVMDSVSANLMDFFEWLPIDIQTNLTNLETSLTLWMENFLTGVELPGMSALGSYVGSVVDVIFLSIITILAAYFLTAERDNIGQWMNRVLPKSVMKYYNMIMDSFKKAIGGYFKAQFKIMMILTFIMFIGFEIMDIGFSFLLALVIAFLDFLPVFGTGAVFWPWIVVDIIAGDYKQAIFLGIMYLVCQLVKQLLQPKMVGDSVGMHPLSSLLYMFIGYRLGGVFGMIIGIPVGMILVNLYKAGMFDQFIKGFKIIVQDINEFRKY